VVITAILMKLLEKYSRQTKIIFKLGNNYYLSFAVRSENSKLSIYPEATFAAGLLQKTIIIFNKIS